MGCVRHQFYGPLLDGRADETVQRAGIADLVGFDYLAETTDNAGFGVSEGSIEIEDEGWKWGGHGFSFSECCGKGQMERVSGFFLR
jgi:hypothetical protein